jgi:hypothetical protein
MYDDCHRIAFTSDTELVEYVVDMGLDITTCRIQTEEYSTVLYHY